MKPKKYMVPFSYRMAGVVEIEADDIDDLKRKFEDDEFIASLPTEESEYEEGSDVFHVDYATEVNEDGSCIGVMPCGR